MNEIVLRLAQRTAILLESVCQNQPEEIQIVVAPVYFKRLGSGYSVNEPYIDTPGTIDDLCIEINSTLNNYEKVYLLLLVQDCLLKMHDAPGFTENLRGIFDCIGIDSALIPRFRGFFEQDNLFVVNTNEYLLLSPQNAINNEMLEGRWIEDNVPRSSLVSGTLTLDQIRSHLLVMFVDPIRTYVVRSINSSEKLFDEDSENFSRFRMLRPGNELSIDGVPVLTFSDLKSRFLHLSEKRELTLTVDQIQYTNTHGIKEIHALSARENTGQLIGIVGREGVGKSTLLKLLAGKFKPGSGKITINGYDLWKNKYLLKGVIGFVPEEDLLFEDLSVADNLSLTARLYYSAVSKKEIEARVNALLSRIDLLEVKHEIVGNIENKQIQPGQRRLVNIALELLREPQILLVDNALSGLGMSDACRVIKVLHDYSFAGNLVITSISQVDSETFLLFDKIWILDKGGYPVYNGSVKAAPAYLSRNLKVAYQENDKTDPAQLLDWVNYRLPDKEEHVWKRVVEPQTWHNEYLRDQALHDNEAPQKTLLPARILKIPNLEVQLLIFSIRNFKCKFSQGKEILKALLIGPFSALLISLLLRSGSSTGYTLLSNENVPFYQFISVVVAIFIGLISSVDEIVRERNILEKEEYQEFSRFSYLNSKILYLFPVIAIQVLLYVLTGNLILGLNEMIWVYWLVLFSAASFGVLLGLVISSDSNNRHFIYKAIVPFVIALQLILGGGVISFDRLNMGNKKFTPLVSDLIVARWGYEALAVEQFKRNAFEKLLYPMDKKLDQAAFYAYQGVPKLEEVVASCFTSTNADSIRDNLELLKNEMTRVASVTDAFRFELLSRLPEMLEKEEMADEVRGYLTYLSYHFYDQFDTLTRQKSLLIGRIADSLGASNLAKLRQDHHNLALEEAVTHSNREKAFEIIDNQIIRATGTIFDEPRSDWGRACLFSPVKQFKIQKTETLWFNISIIWLLTSVCYIWVLFDITGAFRRMFQTNRK